MLNTNAPHPSASDLVFWPPPALESASAEEIVDVILGYRPTARRRVSG